MEELPLTDTTAALLLCGTFGRSGRSDAKPLTPVAYHRFVQWLQRCDLAPHDILDIHTYLYVIGHDCPVALPLVSALIDRRHALAEATARWHVLGIHPLSTFDDLYPASLVALKQQAPPLLFVCGNTGLLDRSGLAIVGSRRADDAALQWTRSVARCCAEQNIVVVSGGADGVDSTAVQEALDHGGSAIVVLAERLAKAVGSSRYAQALADGRLLLASPYDPDSRWSIGNAMARNKLIYALAGPGLVVSTDWQRGGTWAGAVETLRRKTAPLFVRVEPTAPQGNHQLLALGALPFPEPPWDELGNVFHKALPRMVGELGINYTMTSVFRCMLPLIREHCVRPQSIRSLAMLLDASRSRVVAWLDQATNAGEIAKSRRHYVTMEPERTGAGPTALYGAHPPNVPQRAFDRILVLLLDLLAEPHTLGSLSAKLDEPPRQVHIWLRRAIKGGYVMQQGTTYVRHPCAEHHEWGTT